MQPGEIDVRLDDRQEVVEVVGDAAGQDAERLELACLQQLHLDLLALRDLGAQTLGDLLQFGGPLVDPELQLRIHRVGVALRDLQVVDQLLVLERAGAARRRSCGESAAWRRARPP